MKRRSGPDLDMSDRKIITSKQKIETKQPPEEDERVSSSEEEYDFSNDPDEFSCHLCSSSFVTRVSLARHMIVHEHHKTVTCSLCHQSFGRRDDLTDHISLEHAQADQVNIPTQTGVDTAKGDRYIDMVATTYLEDEESMHDDDDDDDDEITITQITNGNDNENDLEDDGEFGSVLSINARLNEKFACEECGESFLNQINLVHHMTSHSILSRPHKCRICNKGFVRKEHLTKHLSSVHSGMKFTCQFCGKDISRKDHLIRHIRNVHTVEYLGIPEESLTLPLNMMQDVHSSAIMSNVAYNSSLDKAIQSLQPKPKKPYLTCDMCDDIFTNLTALHEHQSTVHSDVRKWKCEFCPKAFKRKEHLTKHKVLHTGEKAFPCVACGKQFLRKDALQDHIRRLHSSGNLHLGFACNFCDKFFNQRPNLIRHMKNHHGFILSLPTSESEPVPEQENPLGQYKMLTEDESLDNFVISCAQFK